MSGGGETPVATDKEDQQAVYKRQRTLSNRRRSTHETRLYHDPTPLQQFQENQPHAGIEEPQQEDIGDDSSGDSSLGEVELADYEEKVMFVPPLLTGFKKHVAAAIWCGIERPVLKCHNHISKLLKWPFEGNPSNRAWRNHFRNSGLLRIKDVSYKNPNKNLIAAFVERWHPETNSFHMPFGEMTITLDDVYCLIGLPIAGLPVMSTRAVKAKGNGELERLLGLTEAESREATGGARGSSVKLEWLRQRYNQHIDSDDEDKVLYAARAYALYVFGCSLFADKSGTRVSTAWLEYLEDMSRLHKYAWGAATLAYLYRQLGSASRTKVKQIAGYLTLLEAWIYARFPGLLRPQLNPKYNDQDPLAMKWSTMAVGSSQTRVQLLRESLDMISPSEVNWSVYASVRQRFPLQHVTMYDGCISVNDVVEPYMQDRVLRQYGYVQTIPGRPFVHRFQRNGHSAQEMKRSAFVMARYFNLWDSHCISVDRLGEYAIPPWQCSEDYMEWYRTNSHVRVQNPQFRQFAINSESIAPNPQEMIATATALMDPLLQRWKSDDETVTIEEAMRVMEAAQTALRGVESDMASPPSKRGRR